MTDFIFLGSKITAGGDCSHEIKMLSPWKKSCHKPPQHSKKQRHHVADKSLYSPRDSQECSPTPQFKSINSLALSFVYGPNLRSLHDYWKNHSFDFVNLCWLMLAKSLLFNMLSRFVIAFLPRSKSLLIS